MKAFIFLAATIILAQANAFTGDIYVSVSCEINGKTTYKIDLANEISFRS
jgi:hypothetical protein